MSVEAPAPPRPEETIAAEQTALKPQIGETMEQFMARQEAANGVASNGTAVESDSVTGTGPEAQAPDAPEPASEPEEVQPGLGFGQMEQITYKTGAKHVYGVDEAGKKRHLSHDAVLESYGYSADEAVAAKNQAAADKAQDDALVAEAVKKATPEMVKTAKAMTAEASGKDTNEGVYGLQGKDLVNHGIDIVAAPSKALETTDLPGNGYDGPVRKGMELEKAVSTEVAIPEAPVDNLPAVVSSESVPVLVSGDETTQLPAVAVEAADEMPESAEKSGIRERLRNRWNDIKVRVGMLAQGNFKEAISSQEGQVVTKRRLIGAAAVAGAGVFYWANNKYGWGIDVNPLDGDGFDLNPFNNGEQADAVTGGTPVPFEGTEPTTPEMATVHIDPGEGTSHIARDTLGINFDSVEQWDRFNAATNPLFENLDGVYKDAASGEWRIANPGEFQMPQAILDEMQRVAEQVKTTS